MKNYVLDASALLCLFGQEPGNKRVAQVLKQSSDGQCKVFMSVVNWGEVAYKLLAGRGEAAAGQLLAHIDRLRLQLAPVLKEDALASARLEARHHLPYADSFAAALAIRERAVLVTADEHFERLGKRIRLLLLR